MIKILGLQFVHSIMNLHHLMHPATRRKNVKDTHVFREQDLKRDL